MRRILIGVVISAAPLAAQGAEETGGAGARLPALSGFPASVRAAGLGGISVPLPGDAAVVFDNPSAIGPLRRLSIEGAYARLPDDSWYTTGAAALRVGKVSAGGGYRFASFSEGEVVDNLQWVGALSYRLRGIHVGGSGKYIALKDTTGVVARSLTNDLGITVAVFDIAAIGMAFQNIGRTRLSGAGIDIPHSTHIGLSFNLIDTYSNGRLLAAFETIWTDGAPRRTVIGLEGGLVIRGVGLVARIGHGEAPQGSGVGKTTYGGSLVLGRARLDLAYQKHSAFGEPIHILGFHWTP